eukprot:Amastigsp_a177910_50.p3 type:complete len:133 gc:universal Amastigsp_a177910_50:159-557(+)
MCTQRPSASFVRAQPALLSRLPGAPRGRDAMHRLSGPRACLRATRACGQPRRRMRSHSETSWRTRSSSRRGCDMASAQRAHARVPYATQALRPTTPTSRAQLPEEAQPSTSPNGARHEARPRRTRTHAPSSP